MLIFLEREGLVIIEFIYELVDFVSKRALSQLLTQVVGSGEESKTTLGCGEQCTIVDVVGIFDRPSRSIVGVSAAGFPTNHIYLVAGQVQIVLIGVVAHVAQRDRVVLVVRLQVVARGIARGGGNGLVPIGHIAQVAARHGVLQREIVVVGVIVQHEHIFSIHGFGGTGGEGRREREVVFRAATRVGEAHLVAVEGLAESFERCGVACFVARGVDGVVGGGGSRRIHSGERSDARFHQGLGVIQAPSGVAVVGIPVAHVLARGITAEEIPRSDGAVRDGGAAYLGRDVEQRGVVAVVVIIDVPFGGGVRKGHLVVGFRGRGTAFVGKPLAALHVVDLVNVVGGIDGHDAHGRTGGPAGDLSAVGVDARGEVVAQDDVHVFARGVFSGYCHLIDSANRIGLREGRGGEERKGECGEILFFHTPFVGFFACSVGGVPIARRGRAGTARDRRATARKSVFE